MDYLNDEILLFATRLKASKLFMKVKKTKIMVFMTKQKKKLLATSPLKIDDEIIADV